MKWPRMVCRGAVCYVVVAFALVMVAELTGSEPLFRAGDILLTVVLLPLWWVLVQTGLASFGLLGLVLVIALPVVLYALFAWAHRRRVGR